MKPGHPQLNRPAILEVSNASLHLTPKTPPPLSYAPPFRSSPQLPASPGAGVNAKGACSFRLQAAELAALGDEPPGKRPLFDRLRVIAEELDKGRDEPNLGLRLPTSQIANRPSVHPGALCRLLLGDREQETATATATATADMVAQGLWLEIPCF